MREILFRGKLMEDDVWAEGSLLVDGEEHRPFSRPDLPFSKCYIVPETDWDNIKTALSDNALLLRTVAYHVIPETVGQFTGLTDKNGKKVFEGDIVKTYVIQNNGMKVRKYTETYVVAYHPKYCYFYLKRERKNLLFDGNWAYGVFIDEVVGNIHDNPELLEVKDD